MMAGLMKLLFPPKCPLCGRLLARGERNICAPCREREICPKSKRKLHFLDSYSAVWYYNGYVRRSILRLKFYRARHLAQPLGAILAEHIRKNYPEGIDLITWVPISPLRRLGRGYDQMELVARAAGAELGTPPVRLLKKIRHNRRQSGIQSYQLRRSNVLGAYQIAAPAKVPGKRILLLDDVITTGSTVSECAKVLRQGGAREVHCAAIAAPKE